LLTEFLKGDLQTFIFANFGFPTLTTAVAQKGIKYPVYSETQYFLEINKLDAVENMFLKLFAFCSFSAPTFR